MELSKGGNAPLSAPGGEAPSAVLVGLRWAGAAVELNASAFVVGHDGRAIGEDYFVFFNNPVSPEHSVWLLEPERTTVADQAQIAISLPDLPSRAAKVVVTLATLEEGANLASVSGLAARLVNLHTGEELVSLNADPFTVESLVQVVEIYHHATAGWKVRAILQGYGTGLAGIATDLGIDVA